MNILDLHKQTEDFIKQHNLIDDTKPAWNKFSLGKYKDMAQLLQQLEDDSRVLRIGIIGRVKAGKSSLLNALVFDGEDILPKAATPMTAALTTIAYSETIRAELDFFDEQDVEGIKEQHRACQKKYERSVQTQLDKLIKKSAEKAKKNGTPTPINEQELKEKAERTAQREIKNDPDYAAYDQYQRIKASGLSLQEVHENREISANSIEELMNGKLNQYVSADGRYMPFTKSVNLHIPYEGLKGLEIIDTPGINDPVHSRGIRTEELLKHCDVVFVVSPAGQFLSKEDMELMERVATREGIKEIYLVASQTDNQLLGSESRGQTDPLVVQNNITKVLTTHAHNTLRQKQKDEPEMRHVIDECLKHDVLCTSGIAYSMERRFEQRSHWDSNMNHVLKNLQGQYPDYFNEDAAARHTLSALANIAGIHQKVDEVREKKQNIFKEKKDNQTRAKQNAIRDFLNDTANLLANKVNTIKSSSLEETREKQEKLSNCAEKMEFYAKSVYDDQNRELDIDLRKALNNIVKDKMQELQNESANAQSTGTESYEKVVGSERYGFFWSKKRDVTETRTKEIDIVDAGSIRRAIEGIQHELGALLCEQAAKCQEVWRKGLQKQLVQTLRNKVGEEELPEIFLIDKALKSAVDLIDTPSFELAGQLPSELRKTGKLKKGKGQRYLSHANEYMSNLGQKIRSEITAYSKENQTVLTDNDISQSLTGKIKQDLDTLYKEVENKEATLFKYQRTQDELEVLLQAAAGE